MDIIAIRIEGKLVRARIDLGSPHSFLDRKLIPKLKAATNIKCKFIPIRTNSTNGSRINIVTTALLDICLINQKYSSIFLVSTLPVPVILGSDFFRKKLSTCKTHRT